MLTIGRHLDDARIVRVRSAGCADPRSCILGGDLVEVRRVFEEASERTRELGDPTLRARALVRLGFLAIYEGDDVRARRALEEAVAVWRSLGNRLDTVPALILLGTIAERARDFRAGTGVV